MCRFKGVSTINEWDVNNGLGDFSNKPINSIGIQDLINLPIISPGDLRLARSPDAFRTEFLMFPCILIITAFGRLELKYCERKILLPGWWLEAGGM